MEVEKNIENYIWKGPKVNGVQEEIRLVDCDLAKLQKFRNHCKQMLYNEDNKYPGRYVLIKMVEDQIQHCRAELLVRWLRSEKHYTYQNCFEDLKTIINNNKESLTPEIVKTYPIGNIISDIPNEYKRVPLELVLQACMYSLGVCNTSYISLNFICSLGIYLTQQEMQHEFFEKDPATGEVKNRMDLIKQREGLNPAVKLRYNPTGLSYVEFHQLCKLNKDKYENLTTAQLKLLSDKVLYKFQNRCERQAAQWQEKIQEIEEVANAKGWDINLEIQ